MPLSPRRALASGCLAVLAGLALLPSAAGAGERVEIRRTAGGIPHVEARSWSGLGYGQGHAYAEDNACTLAESIVTVNGERSRHFGPDGSTQPSGSTPAVQNLRSDFFWRALRNSGTVDRLLDRAAPHAPSAAARELVDGFAKGYNRVLRDGVRDPRCRGRAWLRPIAAIDLWRHYHRLALRGSSGAFVTELVAAAPPPATGAAQARRPATDPDWWTDRLGDANGHRGSNAIAVGREAAGRGAGPGPLLANPHFPWRGEERFYQSHARLPGRLDVQGVALHGLPLPVIGHNRDVAWTHTVSPARRFTPVQLALEPGDPTAYRYGGRLERMTPERVTVEALGADGKLEPRTHTFWRTRFGLVANLAGGALRWDAKHAYALADANLSNLRIIDTWLDMARARSVDGLRRAQERHQGIPWVHTVAADRRGVTRYADLSVVPHVTQEKIAACLPPGLPAAVFAAARIVTLDGSRAECGWGEDADAIEPGRFGPGSLPALERTDFVQNSNDSHWLSNPAAPLTGFSPIVGPEGTEQGRRTRLGADSIARRLAGTDGLGGPGFTVQRLERLLLANRSLAAELVLDDLVALCRANRQVTLADGRAVDVSAACPALEGYDRTGDLGARGGVMRQAVEQPVRALQGREVRVFGQAVVDARLDEPLQDGHGDHAVADRPQPVRADLEDRQRALRPGAGARRAHERGQSVLVTEADGIRQLHDLGFTAVVHRGDGRVADPAAPQPRHEGAQPGHAPRDRGSGGRARHRRERPSARAAPRPPRRGSARARSTATTGSARARGRPAPSRAALDGSPVGPAGGRSAPRGRTPTAAGPVAGDP